MTFGCHDQLDSSRQAHSRLPDLSTLPVLKIHAERVRRGTQLHLTSIRNENAYYCCIAQLLPHLQHGVSGSSYPGCPPLSDLRPDCGEAKPIYVCGDSHSLCPSWQSITVRGRLRLLVPALVTGLKAWHLRPESVFYPKVNFNSVVSSIPDGAEVLMLFCEIDCREGILVAVAKGRYKVRRPVSCMLVCLFACLLACFVSVLIVQTR